jgi:hypothetical protein
MPLLVDHQAEILAWVDSVRPGDGLHQRVRLHGIVDVERGEALHIEASKPHSAHHGDTERVSGFLNADSTLTHFSPTSNPCFIRARCGMMSNPNFWKLATSLWPSLTMISMILSRLFPLPFISQHGQLRFLDRNQYPTSASFACQREMIRSHMRAHLIWFDSHQHGFGPRLLYRAARPNRMCGGHTYLPGSRRRSLLPVRRLEPAPPHTQTSRSRRFLVCRCERCDT